MSGQRNKTASMRLGFALALSTAALPAQACWETRQTASRSATRPALRNCAHRVRPESASHRTQPNGSRASGLMQINSAWLPALALPRNRRTRPLWALQHSCRRVDSDGQCVSPWLPTRRPLVRQRRKPLPCTAIMSKGATPPSHRSPAGPRQRAWNDSTDHHELPVPRSLPSLHSITGSPVHEQESRSHAVLGTHPRVRPEHRRRLRPRRHHRHRFPDDVLSRFSTGRPVFLGKSIAIAAFILGAGIGIARSSRRFRRWPASCSPSSWCTCRPSSTAS